jgi:hypothetical protein
MPKLPTACALMLVLCAAACSRPEPPPTDQPPEPKAGATRTDATAQPRGALTEAIQAPIDKAKGVEDTVLDAAEQQRADIDAQTGG